MNTLLSGLELLKFSTEVFCNNFLLLRFLKIKLKKKNNSQQKRKILQIFVDKSTFQSEKQFLLKER